MRSWAAPLALLLAAGSCLGVSTNLAKLGGDWGVPPLALLAWSVLGAALVLSAVAAARGHAPPLTRRTAEYFFAAAFVTVAASNLIFFSAAPRVGAGFVALAIAFPPLLTYLGALCLGMERPSGMRAAGVALALLGAAILAARELAAPDAPVGWLLLTLCGPVLLAIGNLYRTLRWPPGVSGEALAPGMLLAAAAMLLAAGALPGLTLALPLEPRAFGLVLAQVAAFSGQFLLLFLLQRRGGPVLLSLLGSVGAVVGVPVAILVLGEAPPRGLALAAPLIALGVGLVTWGGLRAAEAAPRSSP